MKRAIIIAAALLVLLSVAGCYKTKVTRIEPGTQTDLSGRWNDTDADLVSAEMIKDVLARPWYTEFLKEQGREPVIIVGNVRNMTTEHIDTEFFINDIERELINSGMVKFVASPEERKEIRAELASQQEYASQETMKKIREETGADFMMQGSIKVILDSQDKVTAKTYQTDLQLIHLESTEKVWIGSKEIKKIVSKGEWKP
jgi:uncharacterized protein (TIGR02722 family)